MLNVAQMTESHLPNLPPGSFGAPRIGELREFVSDPVQFMWERYRRHGSIFKTYLGGPMVFMIGPEANKFVMHDRPDHFSFSRGVAPYVRIMFGDEPYSLKDGEPWRRLRQMTSGSFDPETLIYALEYINEANSHYLEKWANSEVVTFFPAVKSLLFETIWYWLTGSRETDEGKELLQTLYDDFVEVPEAREGNLSAYGDPSVRRQRKEKLMAGRTLQQRLSQVMAQRRVQPGQDVLSQWLQANDKNGEGLTDREIISHALMYTVAGSDATCAMLTWFLYALDQYPDVKAKVRAEVDAAIEGDAFAWQDHAKLLYLSYVWKEVERVYSPAFGGTRKVVKTFDFKGYTVPANWNLRMCTFVSHNLPEVFAEPEKFDPDRFAPPREEDKRTPFSLIGFGGGQRLCAGKPYAMVFMTALIVHILKRYDWQILDNQDITPMLHNRATFIPESRLLVRFTAR